jgi:hypothetical protein
MQKTAGFLYTTGVHRLKTNPNPKSLLIKPKSFRTQNPQGSQENPGHRIKITDIKISTPGYEVGKTIAYRRGDGCETH